MNVDQRNTYLTAMQIDTWIPRITLPYAANTLTETEIISAEEITLPTISSASAKIALEKSIDNERPIPPILITPKEPTTETPITANPILKENPRFSLQLMQSGNCLLLVELPTGEAFQIRDPAYQLLKNILRAAKLPENPQWLGDIIHWPLFKQASIPQGIKEAQEFLQSFIETYQEQMASCQCLWLIGLSAIRYTTGMDEQHYHQAPILDKLGQTILAPSLDILLENPQQKAPLWQSIRKLIPSWTL